MATMAAIAKTANEFQHKMFNKIVSIDTVILFIYCNSLKFLWKLNMIKMIGKVSNNKMILWTFSNMLN